MKLENIKIKAQEMKAKVVYEFDGLKFKTARAIERHPDIAAAIAIGVISITGTAIKSAVKMHNSNAAIERRRIERTYYDPATGAHWDLKRKATNSDREAIHKCKLEDGDVYEVLKKRHLI